MGSPTRSASPDSDEPFADLFEEPASFRPPSPPPTVVSYIRHEYGGKEPILGNEEVEVGLVNGHPLWGHVLYPAAIALSRFLEIHSTELLHGGVDGKGKNVLELGAGGGLPGLVAALEGAGNVVISDFPDLPLVNNLKKNVEINIGKLAETGSVANTFVEGFTWGTPPTTLLSHLPASSPPRKFDLILLSDLVFNHSQHTALLDSCLSLLSPFLSPSLSPSESKSTNSPTAPPPDQSTPDMFDRPMVLNFYSHHRPTKELIEADLGFLVLAKTKGWKVQRVWKDKEAGPGFPEDQGDICIRSTVHGWALTRE